MARGTKNSEDSKITTITTIPMKPRAIHIKPKMYSWTTGDKLALWIFGIEILDLN